MPRNTLTAAALALLLAPAAAHADHNSPFGEGWANMPTDNHDEAVERVNLILPDSAEPGANRSDMAVQVDVDDVRAGVREDAASAREQAAEAREMAGEIRGEARGR